MTLFTVHAPPERQGEDEADPMALVFIKEGFSWPALFIPEIWLIVRRLWLVLAGYFAVAIALAFATSGLGTPAAMTILVLFRCFFALEANGLRRWTIEARGWRLVGFAEGRNLEEAELRFFADWPVIDSRAPTVSAPPPPPAMPRATAVELWQPTAENGGVVGLFPTPGARP